MSATPGLQVTAGNETVYFDTCRVYENWLTRTISWLLGWSVDVQAENKVLRMNIDDIATTLLSLKTPHGDKKKMVQDLKELTSACYRPLTKVINTGSFVDIGGWDINQENIHLLRDLKNKIPVSR